ncbi:hypothetical protein C8F04DRAFT_962654 [Mycena alexandri]|uniref:C2H2-type domain-containing protein n=1 Tax=Mycena alexandri TaxID=1745969 RepID=A0AAD6SNM1_9AGAR|nr:hypothetical protein C8F04DRAFT_962654 [Mycena alexandri]
MNPHAHQQHPQSQTQQQQQEQAAYYERVAPPARRNAHIPLPVPVPNLIKKSRGRRVPTPGPATGPTPGRDGEPRAFVCGVEGCGKGFVRGEHLKRHVRSIHTYEKPHTCPYEGCGKTFSRRDNLAQHSRVHLP